MAAKKPPATCQPQERGPPRDRTPFRTSFPAAAENCAHESLTQLW